MLMGVSFVFCNSFQILLVRRIVAFHIDTERITKFNIYKTNSHAGIMEVTEKMVPLMEHI